MFENVGLDIVPRWLRYLIVLACLFSPLWLIGLMILIDECDKEELDDSARSTRHHREMRLKEKEARKN